MKATHVARRSASTVAGLVGAGLLVVTFLATGPQAAAPDRVSEGCSSFTPAVAAMESHEIFDPGTGELTVLVEDQAYVLSEASPKCRANPAAQRRLAQSRQEQDATAADVCADMRRAIAENRRTDRGVAVDLDAARRYVAEQCN